MPMRSALLIGLGLTLTGCSANTSVIDPKLVCDSLRPIYPSRQDKLTPGTAEQIAASNAANESICGFRPPPKPVASKPQGTENG